MVTLHSKLWKLCVCNAASTTALFPECEMGLFYEWSYEWMGILSQKPIRTADNRASGRCGFLSLTPQTGVLSAGWEEETHFFSHLPSITEAVRGTQVWHFALWRAHRQGRSRRFSTDISVEFTMQISVVELRFKCICCSIYCCRHHNWCVFQ